MMPEKTPFEEGREEYVKGDKEGHGIKVEKKDSGGRPIGSKSFCSKFVTKASLTKLTNRMINDLINKPEELDLDAMKLLARFIELQSRLIVGDKTEEEDEKIEVSTFEETVERLPPDERPAFIKNYLSKLDKRLKKKENTPLEVVST